MLGRVDAGGTLHEDHSHTRLLPLVGCIVGAVVGFAKDLVASIDQGWRHAFASVGGVGVGSCFVEPLFLPFVFVLDMHATRVVHAVLLLFFSWTKSLMATRCRKVDRLQPAHPCRLPC